MEFAIRCRKCGAPIVDSRATQCASCTLRTFVEILALRARLTQEIDEERVAVPAPIDKPER